MVRIMVLGQMKKVRLLLIKMNCIYHTWEEENKAYHFKADP